MRLPDPFVRLPLRFDAARLVEEVARYAAADWQPHPQGFPGNAALPLVSHRGDPHDDHFVGPFAATAHLHASPYLRQVLARFGAPLGRVRLMRLDPGAETSEHVDVHPYWFDRVRVHVPVVTNEAVTFRCGFAAVHMRAGEAWIFDTWRLHNVENRGDAARIHLVIDTVGSPELWRLVARGARLTGSRASATPDAPSEAPEPGPLVPLSADGTAALRFEGGRPTAALAAREIDHRVEVVLAAARPADAASPELARLRACVDAFRWDWAAARAEGGDTPEGLGALHDLVTRTDALLERFVGRFRLSNRVDLVAALRRGVLEDALDPELALVPAAVPPFDRPVHLVCPPRSGSTLVFETLARAASVWTLDGESHAVLEAPAGLAPADRGFDSNRLVAADCTDDVRRALLGAFRARLVDRDGAPPPVGAAGLRLVEKTPKNALRVPFLAALHADARFLLVHREPRDVLSSLLDGWRSGRFVTYPDLPGWDGPPWSFALVPGWRELRGRPLAEIVAFQWATLTTILLDDLAALPPEHVAVTRYADLVADPEAEVARVCRWAELARDAAVGGLPLARHTLSPPSPDKWRRNAAELDAIEPIVAPVRARLRAFVEAR